jgi:hypothetical protein
MSEWGARRGQQPAQAATCTPRRAATTTAPHRPTPSHTDAHRRVAKQQQRRSRHDRQRQQSSRPTTAPAGGCAQQQQARQRRGQAGQQGWQGTGKIVQRPARLSRLPACRHANSSTRQGRGAPPSRPSSVAGACRGVEGPPNQLHSRGCAPAGGQPGGPPATAPKLTGEGAGQAVTTHRSSGPTANTQGSTASQAGSCWGTEGPPGPATQPGLKPRQVSGQAGRPPQPLGLQAQGLGRLSPHTTAEGSQPGTLTTRLPTSQQHTTRHRMHAGHNHPPDWQQAHLSAPRRQPAWPRRASHLQQQSAGKGRAGSSCRAVQAGG